jgi:hypothetical protein
MQRDSDSSISEGWNGEGSRIHLLRGHTRDLDISRQTLRVFGIRNSSHRLIVHFTSPGVIHRDRNRDASPQRLEPVEQIFCTEITVAVAALEFQF